MENRHRGHRGIGGAAVAVGKLLGLTIEKLQQAISFAALQVTGMRISFDTTDTKPFHVGRAAQNGLVATLLVQRGLWTGLRPNAAGFVWCRCARASRPSSRRWQRLEDNQEHVQALPPATASMHAEIDGWVQVRTKALQQGLTRPGQDRRSDGARVHPRVLFTMDHPGPKTGLAARL